MTARISGSAIIGRSFAPSPMAKVAEDDGPIEEAGIRKTA